MNNQNDKSKSKMRLELKILFYVTLAAISFLSISAFAFYKSNDPVFVREGLYDIAFQISFISAAVGLLMLTVSLLIFLIYLIGLFDRKSREPKTDA